MVFHMCNNNTCACMLTISVLLSFWLDGKFTRARQLSVDHCSNLNSGTRELALKCKFKCYINPWITHWALALVKGNREPHEAKKKSFDLGGNRTHDLRIRSSVTLPTELQGRTEKSGTILDGESRRIGRGFDSHRGQKIFSLPRVVPCFPLLGLTPSGLFMGLCST